MSAIATPAGWLSNRRNLALAALFAIAVSLAIAIAVYNRGGFSGAGNGSVGDAARNALNQGITGMNSLGETVAGLFGLRSPGERAEGVLANSKQRQRPALHQRALPKVRRGPSTTIASAVPPGAPPAAGPLYNAVTDTPKAALPETPLGFTPAPGGPGTFPGFWLPGGGGVIVPPVTISPPGNPTPPTTPTVPTVPTVPTPPTALVPEPASWVMMLLGFMLIGGVLRRDQSTSLPA